MKTLFVLWIFFTASDGSEITWASDPVPFSRCTAVLHELFEYDRVALVTGRPMDDGQRRYNIGCRPALGEVGV